MPLTLFIAPDAPTARAAAWEHLRVQTTEAPLIFASTDAHDAWRALAGDAARITRAPLFFENAAAAQAEPVGADDRVWMLSMLAARRAWNSLDGLLQSTDGVRALSGLWADMCRAQTFALPSGVWRDEANQLFGLYRALLDELNGFDRENAPALLARNADFECPHHLIIDDLLDPWPALQIGLTSLTERAENVVATLIAPGGIVEHAALQNALDWWKARGADIINVAASTSAGATRFSADAASFSAGAASFSAGAASFSADATRFSAGAARSSAGAARFSAGAARFSADAARFSAGAARFSAGAARLLGDAVETTAPPTLQLTGCHTPWDEVTRVAHAIRAQLEGGEAPENIGLVVADLDGYASLLRAAFAAHGVPLFIPFEPPLLLSPLVRRLLCALENANGSWSADDLVDLFGDDTLRLQGESGVFDAPRLRAALRAVGRREVGDADELRALLQNQADDYRVGATVSAALNGADLELVAEFQGLTAPDQTLLDARGWQNWFEARLERLAGHWEAQPGEAGELARVQLVRLRAAAREVAIRSGKWRGDETVRYLAREWLSWLRAECAAVQGAPPPQSAAIWARDLFKTTQWQSSVYLLGLNEGVWPTRRVSGPLAARDRETLLSLRGWEGAPIARATHLLARALGETEQLSLSFCNFRDGREIAPSPLIEDVRAAWPDHAWLSLPRLEDAPPTSRAAWLNALAADPSATAPPALATLRRIAVERADANFMGIYDGDLGEQGAALMEKWTRMNGLGQWSASALERFARCPLRFFFERVLQIEVPDEIGDELAPSDTGTLIHQILKAFHRRFDAPLRAENYAEALQLMEQLAANECAQLPLPPVLREAEARRLMGNEARPGPLCHTLRAEIERAEEGGSWEQSTRPALHVSAQLRALSMTGLEENFRDLPVGGTLVRGTVDRLDLSDDEKFALIIDYKTGSAKSLPTGDDVTHFQLAIYALWARTFLPTTTRLGVGFLLTSSGEFVKGIGQAGTLKHKMKVDGTPYQNPLQSGATTLNDDEFEAWLRNVESRVAQIAALRRAGRFHLSLQPRDKAGCNTCDFAHVCARNDAVQAARADAMAGDEEVYLPVS